MQIALRIIATLLFSLRASQALASQDYFVPMTPQNAHTIETRGVIRNFAEIQGHDEFDIMTQSGERKIFRISGDFRINGKRIFCQLAPDCDNWPHQIIVGKSTVKVFYWETYRDSKKVLVGNRIESLDYKDR